MPQRLIQLVETDNGRMVCSEQLETKGETVEAILPSEYTGVRRILF